MSVSRSLKVPWVRIIGLLVTVAALTLLQACSAIRLAYNNLPDLAYWWLDGYADMNEVQSLQVRADLVQLYRWHRSVELVKVADLLQKVRKLAPADTTPEQVCGLFADARDRFDAVSVRAETAAATLAVSLTAAQIKHIEARYEKGNAEWRREWESSERSERLDKRVKASVERVEQFYGALDEPQRAVLQAAVSRGSFDPQRNHRERIRRQQDLLQTLRTLGATQGGERASIPAASAALRAYMERSTRSPDPAYRAYADSAVLDNCRTYAQLHNSTTAQQRTRAMERVAAYERDARELAAPS